MIHFHVGVDTYGAVQPVAGTRIVTRFWMVSGFPCWPLESPYVGPVRRVNVEIRLDADELSGAKDVPVLIPARLFWPSIVAAYVRGVAAMMILPGAILLLVAGVMYLTGEQPDIPLPLIAGVGAGLCGIGLTIGGFSYPIFWQVSARQRAIRLAANAVYGVSIDPARFYARNAELWAVSIDQQLSDSGVSDFRQAAETAGAKSPEICRLLLMRVRLQIAMDDSVPRWDQLTDRLLSLVPEGQESSLSHFLT